MDLSFVAPWALLTVPLVLLLAWALVRWRQSRASAGLPFPDVDVFDAVAVRPRRRRHVPTALAVLAASLLALAVARPQMPRDVPRDDSTIMLAIDVSGSMAAADVQPFRLRAAQDAALRFTDEVPRAYQVGLVSFAGVSSVIVPPTTDRDQLRTGIESLDAVGATAIGDAIVDSLDAIAQHQGGQIRPDSARILLLSDGSNTEGTSVAAAVDQAQGAGVPIFTVALGTQDGILPNGKRVPPDIQTLQQVAEQTGGKFYEAKDAESVSNVYAKLGTFIGTERVTREVTAIVAGFGVGALLLAGLAWWRWGVRLS